MMGDQDRSNSFEDPSSLPGYTSSSAGNSNIQCDRTGDGGSCDSINPGITNSEDTTNNHYDKILHCLHTSRYESHRKRVGKPADGTCTWVTTHQNYTEWLGEKKSSLLWLSADPGCGKSVIASFLVDHLRDHMNATVCYFFFNDDYDEQRRPAFALCAILHQLFKRRKALCKYAAKAFEAKGRGFTEEVDMLWDILAKAVAEGECGEVICVVDALDECEEVARAQFIRHVTKLPELRAPGMPLKFLVTGRPYSSIEKELGSSAMTLRLKGEGEVKAITADVNLVIDKGIDDLESHFQRSGELEYLRERLKSRADRTFIWVSLVLASLKDCVDYSKDEFTEIASTDPHDLAVLYNKILSKRSCHESARRILNIVVAAIRPLSLFEMYAAFTINENQTSIRDLGNLPSKFQTRVKDMCGLFVRVIDSEIYLVHQTAREFLIGGSLPGMGDWQYSLSPINSNFIMADICLKYLALDFENNPVDPLLKYAASHWADHFGDLQDLQEGLFECTQRICEHKSSRFRRWFEVYWEYKGQYRSPPNDFTHLMIACWLGQQTVVERLLEEGRNINARSKEYGTALNIAALRNNHAMAMVLLAGGVGVYIGGKEYNISNVGKVPMLKWLADS